MMPPDLISAAEDTHALQDLNHWLARHSAQERVAWALETLPGEHALSSSFGAQSAAILHLVLGDDVANKSGLFFNGMNEMKANAQAYDEAARRRLRELSLRLTGLSA